MPVNRHSQPGVTTLKTQTFIEGLPKRFFLRAVEPSNRPIRHSDSGVAAISEKRCASYSSAACQDKTAQQTTTPLSSIRTKNNKPTHNNSDRTTIASTEKVECSDNLNIC